MNIRLETDKTKYDFITTLRENEKRFKNEICPDSSLHCKYRFGSYSVSIRSKEFAGEVLITDNKAEFRFDLSMKYRLLYPVTSKKIKSAVLMWTHNR